MTNSPCPACHAASGLKTLRAYSATEAASYFCPPSRDPSRHTRLLDAIRQTWTGDRADILSCPACGFSFAHPHHGGNEAFYSALHEQAGYPRWRWDYDVALSGPAFSAPAGRALDIGAGSGVFLKRLAPGWERNALESSPVTRDMLAREGIRVHAGAADAAASGAFDAITLFQVLEHIAPFEDLIADIHRLLRPGGHLVITVPHGTAMNEQEARLGAPDMPPNHVNRWTPESLALVLRRHGLETVATLHEPDRWSLVPSRLQLAIMSAAAHSPRSLAAAVYRLRSRPLRIPALALLACAYALRHLPDLAWMRRGGAFALTARKA
jgi:2-polyprenyl-3-methyl-5-hydroxy-6-metoxy-1,4-benzoquinol methylase